MPDLSDPYERYADYYDDEDEFEDFQKINKRTIKNLNLNKKTIQDTYKEKSRERELMRQILIKSQEYLNEE